MSHEAVRGHLMDGVKAAPVAASLWAWFNHVDWPMWSAFAGLVYAALLILDKLGLLAPLKASTSRLFKRVSGRA